MTAATRGQEGHGFLSQLVEVVVGGLNIAEWIATKNRTDHFGIGHGIENQVRFRLRLAVFSRERVVHQVIEDLSVETGFFSVILEESSERIDKGRGAFCTLTGLVLDPRSSILNPLGFGVTHAER